MKKAILLTYLGKAEIVTDKKSLKLRSVRKVYPWPSVIKLNTYIRLPHKKIVLSRKNILKRDNHRCAYCGRGDLPLTIDHIIPKSRDGEDVWENLAAACLPCNNKKGDRTPHEAGLALKIKPYAPNHINYLINSMGRLEESWKPYLFQS